jgi:hypothetical protein
MHFKSFCAGALSVRYLANDILPSHWLRGRHSLYRRTCSDHIFNGLHIVAGVLPFHPTHTSLERSDVPGKKCSSNVD